MSISPDEYSQMALNITEVEMELEHQRQSMGLGATGMADMGGDHSSTAPGEGPREEFEELRELRELRERRRLRELAERDAAMDMLAKKFKITSAFVRVGTLSKILGLAGATIYAQMREGRFFIQHRLLNCTPAVKLEDLASWYCGVGRLDLELRCEAAAARAEERKREKAESMATEKRSAKERSDQMVAQVLKDLGIDASPRSKARRSR